MTFQQQLNAFVPYNEQEASDQDLFVRYLAQFDDLYTRENPLAHLTASCWIVNPRRDKVLMAYHKLYDSWAWLGGHADGQHNLLQVALKEGREEAGIQQLRPLQEDIFSLEVLGVNPHVKKGRFISAHLHLNVTYLFEASEEQALFCKPDENSAVAWFETDRLLAAVSEPQMHPIYQKLMDKVRLFPK